MKTNIIYAVLFSILVVMLSENRLLGQVENQIEIEYKSISELGPSIKDSNNYIIILMNKCSQLLVDGKKCSLDEMKKIFINSFQTKTSNKLNINTNNLLIPGKQETKIYVQKDTKTNQEDFNLLIEKLSAGIAELQDFYSNKVFSKNYKNLNAFEKEKINFLIQPILYTGKDKNMGNVQQELVRVTDSVDIRKLMGPGNSTKVGKGACLNEYIIPVNEKIPELKLLIGAQTKSGIITFRIYDPNGKKRDNFSLKFTEQGQFYDVSKELPEQKALYLEGARTTSDDTVQATFSASYNNPIQGKWKIIVTAPNAEGYVSIYQELKN